MVNERARECLRAANDAIHGNPIRFLVFVFLHKDKLTNHYVDRRETSYSAPVLICIVVISKLMA